MRIKEISFFTTDTPWTLDTYQIFNMDRATEMTIKDWSRELNMDLDYDDLEWEHDTEEYLKALRDELERLLQEYIIDDVIKSVKLGEVSSPRYYNYTTDGANVYLEVDLKELEDYIAENKEDYEENKKKSRDGFMWTGDEIETKVDYYLRAESTKKLSEWDAIDDCMHYVEEHNYIHAEPTEETKELFCPIEYVRKELEEWGMNVYRCRDEIAFKNKNFSILVDGKKNDEQMFQLIFHDYTHSPIGKEYRVPGQRDRHEIVSLVTNHHTDKHFKHDF